MRRREPLAVLAPPKRKKRDWRLLPPLALVFSLAMGHLIDSGKLRLDGQPVAQKIHVNKHGRAIVVRDTQQHSLSIQWIALDPNAVGYATAQTALAATAASVPTTYGAYTVADGVDGYSGLKIIGPFFMSNSELASAGLATIDGVLVHDRFNLRWSRNQFYAAPTYRTNEWGYQHRIYGRFLTAPAQIPWHGEELRVAIAKGTSARTALYISHDGAGDFSGDSYLNAAKIADTLGAGGAIDTTDFDLLCFCGDIWHDYSEGTGSSVDVTRFYTKTGTSNARLQVMSHPVDAARFIGTRLSGSGFGFSGIWTSAGSGAYDVNTGTSFIPANTSFVAYRSAPGAALRFLQKVSSRANSIATANSWYFDGANTLTVRLAEGTDPTLTVFCIAYMTLDLTSNRYFDIWGIDFLGSGWLGSGALQQHDYAWYSCSFGYTATFPTFSDASSTFNEATGAFTDLHHYNRTWIGCWWRRQYVAIYDGNAGHSAVPVNTLIRDNVCEEMNWADNHGVNCFSASDAHQFTNQGARIWKCINNVFDESGCQAIALYLQPNNFLAPSGGLEATAYYTTGAPPADWFTNDAGVSYTYAVIMKDIEIAYNLFTAMRDPRGAGEETSAQMIALNGDNGQCLGVNGNYGNINIHHNLLEVDGCNDGGLRSMYAYSLDDQNDIPQWHHNRVYAGTVPVGFPACAIRTGNNTPVTGPMAAGTYEPSFAFYDNFIQCEDVYVQSPNRANPDFHLQIYDRNTYTGGGLFDTGAGEIWNFADWKTHVPAGDIHDPNSQEI